MDTAVVLGNGPSRLKFDLSKITYWAKTFGCNAIYRDYMPDYLIAMDWNMVEEIVHSGFHNYTQFYTQHENRADEWAKTEPIHFVANEPDTLDSGNSAIKLAIQKGHRVIYLVGFDYVSGEEHNNIYAGTKNYNVDAFYHHNIEIALNWQKSLRRIVQQNPDVTFIRVNARHDKFDIHDHNFTSISTEEFKRRYDE